jgi:hypothetical protein
MLRDLRKPDGPTYDVEAINKRMPSAFALFAVSCLVVIGAVAGGLAGMWWALLKYGGTP